MKKVIERIVESHGAPSENDLWLNGTTLKKFQNGEWVAISGGDSDGGSSVMFVEGTVSQGSGILSFTPASGAPAWQDAYTHIAQGGPLYFVLLANGVPIGYIMAVGATQEAIIGVFEVIISWQNPNYQPPE